MGWDRGGCGRGVPSQRGSGLVPRNIFGQNPAFWFVLGKKMCSSTLDRNINTTPVADYWDVRDTAVTPAQH